MLHSIHLDEIIEHYEEKCPICGSTMKLLNGKFGLFFGCTQFFRRGCPGKMKVDKETLEEIEEFCEELEWDRDAMSGLMDAFPDWDPDKMDFETYRDINGY